jgi:thiol-disulfide isomerase/thioredoxin
MNKKMALITLAILAVIMAGVAYLLLSGGSKDAKDQMVSIDTVQEVKQSVPDTSPSQPEQPSEAKPVPGSYVDYKEGVIAATSGTKLLFFHASWCPQCRALEADIKQKGVPSGVTIIKVDYDTSQKLRQQYGVTLQTTVVRVDDNGNLVKKFVAYDDPSLGAIITNLL